MKRGADALNENRDGGSANVTATNPMGIVGAEKPYHVTTTSNMPLHDVVLECDMTMIRQITQVALFHYTGHRSQQIYINYQEKNRTYQICFCYPKSQHITLAMMSDLYKVQHFAVDGDPWVEYTTITNTGGQLEEVVTLNIILSSATRQQLTITRREFMFIDEISVAHNLVVHVDATETNQRIGETYKRQRLNPAPQ